MVGIASFGIQLSQILYKFSSQVRSAQDSLQAVVESVGLVSNALQEIHRLLEIEHRNLQSGNRPKLFSEKSMSKVKDTADQCLIVFWRIEGTVLNNINDNAKFDEQLALRLQHFNQKLQNNPEDLSLGVDRRLELLTLSLVGRIRWAYIQPKLDQYCQRLRDYQVSLTLIFTVISYGEQRMRP